MARLLFVGATKLKYSEDELFRMTPRKFFRIYEEYLELNGLKKEKSGIDDLP